MEKERLRMRNIMLRYEEENKVLLHQLEEKKIENIEI
jgi:hypothetical protein